MTTLVTSRIFQNLRKWTLLDVAFFRTFHFTTNACASMTRTLLPNRSDLEEWWAIIVRNLINLTCRSSYFVDSLLTLLYRGRFQAGHTFLSALTFLISPLTMQGHCDLSTHDFPSSNLPGGHEHTIFWQPLALGWHFAGFKAGHMLGHPHSKRYFGAWQAAMGKN